MLAVSPERVEQLVADMDRINLQVMVNLSGGYGPSLKEMIQVLKGGKHKDRFVVFANLNFANIDDPDWSARAVTQLEEVSKTRRASASPWTTRVSRLFGKLAGV
jgi:hypothetical protein